MTLAVTDGRLTIDANNADVHQVIRALNAQAGISVVAEPTVVGCSSESEGRPLFTHQQLAQLLASENQQAASQHLEDFGVITSRPASEQFSNSPLHRQNHG